MAGLVNILGAAGQGFSEGLKDIERMNEAEFQKKQRERLLQQQQEEDTLAQSLRTKLASKKGVGGTELTPEYFQQINTGLNPEQAQAFAAAAKANPSWGAEAARGLQKEAAMAAEPGNEWRGLSPGLQVPENLQSYVDKTGRAMLSEQTRDLRPSEQTMITAQEYMKMSDPKYRLEGMKLMDTARQMKLGEKQDAVMELVNKGSSMPLADYAKAAANIQNEMDDTPVNANVRVDKSGQVFATVYNAKTGAMQPVPVQSHQQVNDMLVASLDPKLYFQGREMGMKEPYYQSEAYKNYALTPAHANYYNAMAAAAGQKANKPNMNEVTIQKTDDGFVAFSKHTGAPVYNMSPSGAILPLGVSNSEFVKKNKEASDKGIAIATVQNAQGQVVLGYQGKDGNMYTTLNEAVKAKPVTRDNEGKVVAPSSAPAQAKGITKDNTAEFNVMMKDAQRGGSIGRTYLQNKLDETELTRGQAQEARKILGIK